MWRFFYAPTPASLLLVKMRTREGGKGQPTKKNPERIWTCMNAAPRSLSGTEANLFSGYLHFHFGPRLKVFSSYLVVVVVVLS